LIAPRYLMVRGLDDWIVRVRHDRSATLLRGGTRIILYFGAIGPGTVGNGPVSPSKDRAPISDIRRERIATGARRGQFYRLATTV
jgi:hypothetical protein